MKIQIRANLAWKEKGGQTREMIESYLLQNPGSSSYKIAKSMGYTTGGIKYHLEILEHKGRIKKNIHLLGNKGVVNYYIIENGVNKFYLENIKESGWHKGQKLQLYLRDYQSFSLAPKISKIDDDNCIIRTPVTLLKDNKGYYIIPPENIKRFYFLDGSKRLVEQSLGLLPNPKLLIVFTSPDSPTLPLEETE